MLKGKHLLRQSAKQVRQETAYIKNNDREKNILLKSFIQQGDQTQIFSLPSAYFHFLVRESEPGIKCISGILSAIQLSCCTDHSFIS
jgi:hypothetical protein